MRDVWVFLSFWILRSHCRIINWPNLKIVLTVKTYWFNNIHSSMCTLIQLSQFTHRPFSLASILCLSLCFDNWLFECCLDIWYWKLLFWWCDNGVMDMLLIYRWNYMTYRISLKTIWKGGSGRKYKWNKTGHMLKIVEAEWWGCNILLKNSKGIAGDLYF